MLYVLSLFVIGSHISFVGFDHQVILADVGVDDTNPNQLSIQAIQHVPKSKSCWYATVFVESPTSLLTYH